MSKPPSSSSFISWLQVSLIDSGWVVSEGDELCGDPGTSHEMLDRSLGLLLVAVGL